TVRLLGARYDIHGAGLDLKFPHHEAEIAQAETATGEHPLVNFWMHAGLLTLRGEKMSKSLGNVVGLDDALDRYGAMPLRFFYLNAHYRSPLDYVEGKSLEEASEAYDRLRTPWERLREAMDGGRDEGDGAEIPTSLEAESTRTVTALDEALADDFNTREAIALLFSWGRALGEWLPRFGGLSPSSLETLAGPYRWAEEVLGLFEAATPQATRQRIGPLVEVALEARQRARSRGDFTEADRIRDALARGGVRIEDAGAKARWELVGAGE
ncbi:MAG: class I tRNA ligase family protein, partial [Thermoplasmata archaeon]|nr:class I tRNA ligase family protein [Thermoplasmata archaeon]